MSDKPTIEWGQFQDGELLRSWPRKENGDPEEPAYLCLRSCSNMEDQLTVSMLRAYGIPCLCMERAEGSLGRVVLGISGYGVEIYVPENLLEDAKTLIEDSSSEA
jgi:hypothetical protein